MGPSVGLREKNVSVQKRGKFGSLAKGYVR